MTAATLAGANGRADVTSAPSVTFTNPLDNVPFSASTVTSHPFTVSGNPLLVTSCASAYVSTAGLATCPFTLTAATGVTAGTPQAWINPPATHSTLLRTFALLTGVPAASATVTAQTGANEVQDVNDVACATVCELGPDAPLAVRAIVPPASAQAAAAGQPILYQPFVSFGGRLLIRAAGTAKSSANDTQMTLAIELDGQEVARSELYGSGNQFHFATVPVDVLVDAGAGPHVVAIRVVQGGTTDSNDYTTLLVLEQTGPPGAIEINPVLVNAPCLAQPGSGTAAFATFSSGGGTLVIQAAASAFATVAGGIPLNLTLELDGQPLVTNGSTAILHEFGNTVAMHLPMVPNDFVAPGVAAGSHTLALVADKNTNTTADDRVSITVMELGPAAG